MRFTPSNPPNIAAVDSSTARPHFPHLYALIPLSPYPYNSIVLFHRARRTPTFYNPHTIEHQSTSLNLPPHHSIVLNPFINNMWVFSIRPHPKSDEWAVFVSTFGINSHSPISYIFLAHSDASSIAFLANALNILKIFRQQLGQRVCP